MKPNSQRLNPDAAVWVTAGMLQMAAELTRGRANPVTFDTLQRRVIELTGDNGTPMAVVTDEWIERRFVATMRVCLAELTGGKK